MNLDASSLFFSLLWGSIGLGFSIYGKKQGDMIALFGGVALMILSYFVGDALWMSVTGIAIIAGMLWLKKRP